MIKDLFYNAIALVFPASSYTYVTNSLNFFGPVTPWEIVMYNRLKPRLRAEKIAKEGYRNDVYKDSLGYLTVGIGHKVVAGDNLKFGDKISNARVEQLFDADCRTALQAAINQAKELRSNPSDSFIIALSQVNFQLGTNWRAKFPTTWEALRTGNWQKAIKNLETSTWNKQTPVRVSAFISAIKQEFA